MARLNRRREATRERNFGMSKYIIKNCPARLPKSGLCIEAPKKKAYLCEDCIDCILKQIVELCKETCRKRCTNDCLGTKKHCGYGQILQKLDIQEIE